MVVLVFHHLLLGHLLGVLVVVEQVPMVVVQLPELRQMVAVLVKPLELETMVLLIPEAAVDQQMDQLPALAALALSSLKCLTM
jgi:hypothetical protein